MNIFILIPGVIAAALSSAMIAHISMVTSLGPWVAPTIVLASGVGFRLLGRSAASRHAHQEFALIQTVGSVGGIIGMGLGFTLPMLYFLEPQLFQAWLSSPGYFVAVIGSVCMAAGLYGLFLGRSFAHKLITVEKLAFPVSDLIFGTISSQAEGKQSRSMFSGFGAAALITGITEGFAHFRGFIPKMYFILPSFFGRELAVAIWPIAWSMGFIIGMGIVFPLAVGLISRYLILYPLNYHAQYLSFSVFQPLPFMNFMMAFCSGIVLIGVIVPVMKYPGYMWKAIKNRLAVGSLQKSKNWSAIREELNGWLMMLYAPSEEELVNGRMSTTVRLLEPAAGILGSFALFTYFGFNPLCQIALLVLTAVFCYQISYFGGKVGLVPFGRFNTFVLLPLLVFFKLSAVQLTILCVFVNVVYAVATDLLFDYQVGAHCGISRVRIHRYQYLGLIITALTVGFFLWVLFTSFKLGSPELFAHRARARALLIQSLSFDFEPVLLGCLYGLALKRFRLNPMMVFGGILMPTTITLGLIVGALISKFDKRAKEHVPFWSGVFAGESTWTMVSILARMVV